MADHLAIEKGLALSLAVNAMIDKLGTIGIVLPALLFGEYTTVKLPLSVLSPVPIFANAPKLSH